MITLSLENKVDNGDTKVKIAFKGQQNKEKKEIKKCEMIANNLVRIYIHTFCFQQYSKAMTRYRVSQKDARLLKYFKSILSIPYHH